MLDDVNGQIIGGDFISWKLFYNNESKMYNKAYSENEEEALKEATKLKHELINENPKKYTMNGNWEMKIY